MNIKVGKLYRAINYSASWNSSDQDQKIYVRIQKGSIIMCIKHDPERGQFLCKEGIIYIPKWFYDYSQAMLDYFEEVI